MGLVALPFCLVLRCRVLGVHLSTPHCLKLCANRCVLLSPLTYSFSCLTWPGILGPSTFPVKVSSPLIVCTAHGGDSPLAVCGLPF